MDELMIVDGMLPAGIMSELIEVENKVKEYEKKQKELKAKILDAMKDADIVKIDADGILLTVVPETTAERLDSKALKEELPDVYDSYVSIQKRAAYLKVTVR